MSCSFYSEDLQCGPVSGQDDVTIIPVITCDQASLLFLRLEGTPDTITLLFVRPRLIKISVSENVGDAISG